jgi:hypothetical protein
MPRPKKETIDVKIAEKVRDAIIVLQDHGEACACWECAQHAKTIEENPREVGFISRFFK